MVGLMFPDDLDSWSRWHASRGGAVAALRRLKNGVRASVEPPLNLYLHGEPTVLVALDSPSPSNRAAVLDPVEHLKATGVAVLAPFDAMGLLPEGAWRRSTWGETKLPNVKAVLALGHYLPAGRAAYAFSVANDLPFGVVQHGLLTPFGPPLPFRATALVWSEEDGEFWRSGRQDIDIHVVGSQLMQNALVPQAEEMIQQRLEEWRGRAPIYLGQLHGSEMPKLGMARAAVDFCRRERAVYRPHPSERDVVSRAAHTLMRRAGVEIDVSGRQLADMEVPIVGVFSTGILEAAAAGIPAFVDYPNPPAWLSDFWRRYGMRRFSDGIPTVPPVIAVQAPADIIAEWALNPA